MSTIYNDFPWDECSCIIMPVAWEHLLSFGWKFPTYNRGTEVWFILLAYRGRSFSSTSHFDHQHHFYALGPTPPSCDFIHFSLCISSLGSRAYSVMDTLVITSFPSWCPCNHFYSLLEIPPSDPPWPKILASCPFLHLISSFTPRWFHHLYPLWFPLFYQHMFAVWALGYIFHCHHLLGLSSAFTWYFTLS